ncbi:MAG TPA: sigma 54-interacting transcriptional regulator [Planctomycetota bacterium]|nr:sigma 54-interacting transcriptional regulator [Planctomycetota bacterium]
MDSRAAAKQKAREAREKGRRRLASGDGAGAVPLLEEAFAHARGTGEKPLELEVLLDLGKAYGAASQHERAIVCLREAWDLAEATNDDASRIEVLLARARVRSSSGDAEGALADYEDARGRARARGDDALAARALEGAREATRIGRPAKRVPAAPETQEGEGEVSRLRRERAFLLRLQEVSRALNAPQEPRQVLDRVVDAAVALTGAERGFLILTAEAKGAAPPDALALAADAERGIPEGLVVACARNLDREHVGKAAFKVSRGVVARALSEKRAVIVKDATEELSEHSSVAEQGLRSLVGVPISCEGRTLGVLYLDNRFGAGTFGEQDVPLLEAFAAQAGVALENARLRTEERAQKDELARARARVEELNEHLKANLVGARTELASVRALADGKGLDDVIGRSPAMREVFRLLERIRESDAPVLVTGESGTGKEVIARSVHRKSKRSGGPFVTENCAAIPSTLFESVLFGHVKGAFTGAHENAPGLFRLADGGTIFLDEVGELPREAQAKLLRAIETGEVRPVGGPAPIKVDVRLIAATNRDLRLMVKEQTFREDLFYRLNVLRVTLPPLRRRREDIPLLLEKFLDREAREARRPSPKLGADAMKLLYDYPWPGNVRELENEIRRLVAVGPAIVTPLDLSASIRDRPRWPVLDGNEASGEIAPGGDGAPGASGPRTLAQAERDAIAQAMTAAQGNKARAAEILAIPRTSLYHRMRRLGMTAGPPEPEEAGAEDVEDEAS